MSRHGLTPALSRNLQWLVHSCSLGDNQLKPKLLRSFCQRSDLLFAISGLVVFGALVHVLLAVLDEPVKEAGELASHGRDGFGSSQAGTQTTVLGAQITLAAHESHGRVTESHGGAIDYFSSSAVQDLLPLCWWVGHRPNQLVNCFSLGKALKSAPASAITVCAVSTSMPLILDQSMLVMRYNSVRRSKAGAFRLACLPWSLGPSGCAGRSSLEPNDCRCFRNGRSQARILF